jgi:thioredoxin
MTELKGHDFDAAVLQADQPVLVDFHAPWCGPCRMLAPALEQLAAEFAGRVRFVKVNVDDAPELAGRYRITGVPTLLLFRDGAVVDTLVGLAPVTVLRQRLAAVAPDAPADRNTARLITICPGPAPVPPGGCGRFAFGRCCGRIAA